VVSLKSAELNNHQNFYEARYSKTTNFEDLQI